MNATTNPVSSIGAPAEQSAGVYGPEAASSPVLDAINSLRSAFFAMLTWEALGRPGGADIALVLADDIDDAFVELFARMSGHDWATMEQARQAAFRAAQADIKRAGPEFLAGVAEEGANEAEAAYQLQLVAGVQS